jgi:hypothetical protein
MMCEVEGRKEPNSDSNPKGISIEEPIHWIRDIAPATGLQVSLDRIWTESELARLIDLFESPRFHSDEVDLDPTRKVAASSCGWIFNYLHDRVSHVFIYIHMFSYSFKCFHIHHMFSYTFICFQIKRLRIAQNWSKTKGWGLLKIDQCINAQGKW